MVLSSKEKRHYSYFTIIPEAFRKGQEKSHTIKEIPWWCGKIVVEGNAPKKHFIFLSSVTCKYPSILRGKAFCLVLSFCHRRKHYQYICRIRKLQIACLWLMLLGGLSLPTYK